MARQDENARPTVARLLSDALDGQGLSVRGFAKQMAGDGATKEAVEVRRRQLNKWLAGDNAPDDESAALLARLLGKPESYFVSPKVPRRQDRLTSIERRLDELEALVRRALERLDRLGDQPG